MARSSAGGTKKTKVKAKEKRSGLVDKKEAKNIRQRARRAAMSQEEREISRKKDATRKRARHAILSEEERRAKRQRQWAWRNGWTEERKEAEKAKRQAQRAARRAASLEGGRKVEEGAAARPAEKQGQGELRGANGDGGGAAVPSGVNGVPVKGVSVAGKYDPVSRGDANMTAQLSGDNNFEAVRDEEANNNGGRKPRRKKNLPLSTVEQQKVVKSCHTVSLSRVVQANKTAPQKQKGECKQHCQSQDKSEQFKGKSMPKQASLSFKPITKTSSVVKGAHQDIPQPSHKLKSRENSTKNFSCVTKTPVANTRARASTLFSTSTISANVETVHAVDAEDDEGGSALVAQGDAGVLINGIRAPVSREDADNALDCISAAEGDDDNNGGVGVPRGSQGIPADKIRSSTRREDGEAVARQLGDDFDDEATAVTRAAAHERDLGQGPWADKKNCGAEIKGRGQKRASRVTRSLVAKREKTSVSVSGEYRVVCAAKSKPTSKSALFMASQASIFAAACKFPSLLSALHGSNNNDNCWNEDWNASICTTYAEIDGCCLAMEHSLAVIYLHFRGCPTFERQFNQLVENAEFLSPCTLERALHRSVRHLCEGGCFQRAYAAIREFAYLWRGVAIEGPYGANGSPGRCGRRPTKEELFSGWGCKMLSPVDRQATSGITKKAKPSSAIAFISPDGNELATKTQATKYMNRSLSSLARTATFSQQGPIPAPTTPLIDTVTNIDPLYSPFGLLEELFLHDPWRLLVSTIFLNVTARVQVDQTLHHFLQGWPDAAATALANWEEIAALVSPLGLGTKRAQALVRFSQEYLALTEDADSFALTEKQVRGLYNIGLYGWTAYKVFILKHLPSGSVKVCDHALQLYVEYQLGRQAAEARERLSFGKCLPKSSK